MSYKKSKLLLAVTVLIVCIIITVSFLTSSRKNSMAADNNEENAKYSSSLDDRNDINNTFSNNNDDLKNNILDNNSNSNDKENIQNKELTEKELYLIQCLEEEKQNRDTIEIINNKLTIVLKSENKNIVPDWDIQEVLSNYTTDDIRKNNDNSCIEFYLSGGDSFMCSMSKVDNTVYVLLYDKNGLTLYTSSDLGGTWTNTVITDMGGYNNVHLSFSDLEHGIIVAGFGHPPMGTYIYKTSNGGKDWKITSEPTHIISSISAEDGFTETNFTAYVECAAAYDENTYMIGYRYRHPSDEFPFIYLSNDAGASWNRVAFPLDDSLKEISYGEPLEFIMLSDKTIVCKVKIRMEHQISRCVYYVSYDGGNTWEEQYLDKTIYDMDFDLESL